MFNTIAERDQFETAMKDMAKILKIYFDDLIEAGFKEHQALKLTAEYMTANIQEGQ